MLVDEDKTLVHKGDEAQAEQYLEQGMNGWVRWKINIVVDDDFFMAVLCDAELHVRIVATAHASCELLAPIPTKIEHVRWAVCMRVMASSSVLSNCPISLRRKWKGMPARELVRL
jgi:hypothetical protein